MAHHPHLPSSDDPTFTAKLRSTWEILRRVSVYLRPYKLMAAATTGCAVLSLGFAFAFPKLTQYVIEIISGDQPAEPGVRVVEDGANGFDLDERIIERLGGWCTIAVGAAAVGRCGHRLGLQFGWGDG